MILSEYQVGDIIELVRRPVKVVAEDTYIEIGLRSYGNGIFHKAPMLGEALGDKKVFYIEPADLLFSNVFAWEGAVALASNTEAGKIGSHRFMTYRVNEKRADSRYLLHYFYGGPGLHAIREASPGSAGRNRTLGIKTFERQIVKLPNLEEQRRIADKLDAIYRRISAATDLRESTQRLGRAIQDSILSEILQWNPLSKGLILALDEVLIDRDATYPIAGVYGFGRGIIERNPILGADTKYNRLNRLRSGTLVMSRLKAFEGALTIVPDSSDGYYVSQEFPTFAVNPEVMSPEYLGHLCRWPKLWSLLSKESQGIGARRERVSAERLLATEVPFPDLETQQQISVSLGKMYAALRLGEEQNKAVTSIKRSLLSAAFSGEL